MKKILLLTLLLLLALFTGCEDSGSDTNNDNNNVPDVPSYWKVTTRQRLSFQIYNDTLSASGGAASPITNSIYLTLVGSDIIAFVVDSNGAYTKATTECTMGQYRDFYFNDYALLDTAYANGNSDFVKFEGRFPIYIRGLSFLFFSTDTSGTEINIEIDPITTELPRPEWTLSTKDLFVDWKTLFKL